MEFQTVIEKRRSIRNFDPGKEVSREQIETLIRAASLAPSWKNLQTSRYYCVLSPSRIEEFRQKCLPESNQKNCAVTASANTPKIRRLSMKNHPASCFANSLQGGFA